MPVTCPNCGEKNTDTVRMCTLCGILLPLPVNAPPVETEENVIPPGAARPTLLGGDRFSIDIPSPGVPMPPVPPSSWWQRLFRRRKR